LHAEAVASQTRVAAEAAADAMKMQAEAQAAATRLNGQAEADAIRARGMAEADAVKARMEAEAIGIERRAAALSQNQEAVIAQQIAENLPEIVRAAASPFEHVGTFTVLNGAEGVTGALAEIIQQAGALTKMARETLMPTIPGVASGNGRSADGATPGHKDIAATTAPVRERNRSRSQADTAAASKGESSGPGT
jgi:flotillin